MTITLNLKKKQLRKKRTRRMLDLLLANGVSVKLAQ